MGIAALSVHMVVVRLVQSTASTGRDEGVILPRSRGQSDYAAIAATCSFNSNSIGLT